MKSAAAAARVDRMFRALSDRTRRRILNLLREGELCVCDIVAVLRVPQPTASRHLAYLRRCKLVVARKQGLWSYYRLAPAASAFHRKLLGCVAGCFGEVPQLAADLRKRRKSCRDDGCCP
jgi:ArsR family transcriptional regulator